MLELNKEYTYKEICEALDWKVQTGNNETKKNQIKTIESSYKFYHPENKKTHKPKKSYIFTEQIKEVELVDGRKTKEKALPDEEFNFLLRCIIDAGRQRNEYFQRGKLFEVYVSNSLIYKKFGFDVYGILKEIKYHHTDIETKEIFTNICLDAVKANTITRICKLLNCPKNSLPKGILRQDGSRGKAAKRKVPDNDLLPLYNQYEQEAAEEIGYKTAADALKMDTAQI